MLGSTRSGEIDVSRDCLDDKPQAATAVDLTSSFVAVGFVLKRMERRYVLIND